MTKTLLLFALASVLTMNNAIAQLTASSIANGNWTSTSTWDCGCVPTAGYDVTVVTAVILDTNFQIIIAANSLVVNVGGSIIEDATPRQITMTAAGTITNAGDINITDMSLTTGTFTNTGNGSATISSFYSSGIVLNEATMTLTNATNANGGTFTNNQFLNFTNFTNIGTFTNNLTVNFTDITNTSTGSFTVTNNATMTGTDMLNQGTFTNSGYINLVDFSSIGGITTNSRSIIPSNDCFTTGSFLNNASGFLAVGNDYLNGDTLSLAQGVMTNAGIIEVGNDFTNLDTITGPGDICIARNSFNSGWVLGTLDFCDTTSVTGGSFDVDIGLIESGITNCMGTFSCFTLDPMSPIPVGIEEQVFEAGIKVYPNPSANFIIIQVEGQKNLEFQVFNSAGQLVLRADENTGSDFTLDISSLALGCYLLKSTDETGAYDANVFVKQ